jgi:hypothetical protein
MNKIAIYAIEAAIGAVLLWFDQRFFFLYMFIVLLITLDLMFNYLRKTIRFFGIKNIAETHSLVQHFGIKEEEIHKVWDELLETLTEKERNRFFKEFRDIMP